MTSADGCTSAVFGRDERLDRVDFDPFVGDVPAAGVVPGTETPRQFVDEAAVASAVRARLDADATHVAGVAVGHLAPQQFCRAVPVTTPSITTTTTKQTETKTGPSWMKRQTRQPLPLPTSTGDRISLAHQ